jgi:hypothetical protein
MTPRLATLALAALLAARTAAAPTLPPDPFDGLWKAYDKAAGPHYQVMTTKTHQAMKIQGLDVKQEQSQTFYIRLTPQDKVDGNWVVAWRVVGAKVEIDVAGQKTVYDSTDPKAANGALAGTFDALLKTDLMFHVNPRTFEVVKVEGRDELVRQMGGANPAAVGVFWNVLSEDAIKQQFGPGLEFYPAPDRRTGKDWADGRKWTRSSTIELGPLGTFKTKNACAWGKDDRVAIEATQEYVAPAPGRNAGLPFAVKTGELEGKSQGPCYAKFDRARGRFKEVRVGMTAKGTLTIDVGGTESTVELEQTQEVTVTTHDRNPLDGK